MNKIRKTPSPAENNQMNSIPPKEHKKIKLAEQKDAVETLAKPTLISGPVVVKDSALQKLKKSKITQKVATKQDKMMGNWIKAANSTPSSKPHK